MSTTVTYPGDGVDADTEILNGITAALADDGHLIIPAEATPWQIAGPAGTGLDVPRAAIYLQDGLHMEINGDLLAKTGQFLGARDCMIRADKKTAFRLSGTGKVRMRKAEYAGEFRHCLNVRGSTDWLVDGALAFNDSGGDGIFIGPSETDLDDLRIQCADYAVKNVVCDNNRRQGISILSAIRALLYGCTLTNSVGTAPQSGLDIEPEYDSVNDLPDHITDLRVVNCVGSGSASRNFFVNLSHMGDTSPPATILFHNCRSLNTVRNPWGWNFSMPTFGPLGGRIDVVNCVARGLLKKALRVQWRVDRGPALNFHNFWSDDCAISLEPAPIELELGTAGGTGRHVWFNNLRISDRFDRALIQKTSIPDPCAEVRGTIQVDRLKDFRPRAAQVAGLPYVRYREFRDRPVTLHNTA